MKRKPSRRANTAERRATHNAVERQRRETLNGRFLDLAALLPNLSQIRRPSKSSIVNSSIAHIHASRRHRLLASRELRSLKLESDALRRELNEWRDRAGLPRVEEPIRAEGFSMVLSGELEVLAAVNDDEDENSAQGYDGYDDGEDDFLGPGGSLQTDEMDHSRNTMLKINNANLFAPLTNAGTNSHIAHAIPRDPIIASSPSAVSFENPAMASLYEPRLGSQFRGNQYIPQQHSPLALGDTEKAAAWNTHAHLYSAPAQQQQLLQQRYIPPTSVHILPPSAPSDNSATDLFSDPGQLFFTNFPRQHQFAAMHQRGHMYGSPDGDDTSSVDSGSHTDRSGGSLGGSGYGSPQHGSPPGSYEIPAMLTSVTGAGPGEYAPRRLSAGSAPWCGDADGMGGLGMMKNTPISVGGGGNGSCFAMMM